MWHFCYQLALRVKDITYSKNTLIFLFNRIRAVFKINFWLYVFWFANSFMPKIIMISNNIIHFINILIPYRYWCHIFVNLKRQSPEKWLLNTNLPTFYEFCHTLSKLFSCVCFKTVHLYPPIFYFSFQLGLNIF